MEDSLRPVRFARSSSSDRCERTTSGFPFHRTVIDTRLETALVLS
jgi:hypothetical protein